MTSVRNVSTPVLPGAPSLRCKAPPMLLIEITVVSLNTLPPALKSEIAPVFSKLTARLKVLPLRISRALTDDTDVLKMVPLNRTIDDD
ncbi:MAG: hypothetical protein JKY52_09500 [Flavobacteriales bacterium]|nr:hypothetical protein [Flavobacteriales bacterium]